MTTVTIVGGGIAGLTTALALHRRGIDATVYEATPQLETIGVGINILPHASRVLHELDLSGTLDSVAVLTKESAFFTRFGQLIYTEPAGRFAGFRYPQYSIHRGDLQQLLADAVRERLGEDRLVLGHRAVSVRDEDRQASTIFETDTGRVTVGSDAVLACDGVHSALRRQLYPNESSLHHTGITMWRGVTVWDPVLSGATMVRAGWFPRGKLVMYPIRQNVDGEGRQLVNWLAEVAVEGDSVRDWSRVGRLEDFLSYYADWHFDWCDVPAFLSAAEMILEYPMVDQEPLGRWSVGRVTLLGDAAHPMVPRGSNGAGQAILDAESVARCLAAHKEVSDALLAYEAERREATTQVVLTNRVNPPDAILREVYERSGDRPFSTIDEVISQGELRSISDRYKQISGLADLLEAPL